MVEERRRKLTHPAVACLHSSFGTYASLDRLKERPAFPHHLNRLVPLLFHSLEGSPTKTRLLYPCSPPHFCLHLLIVSTRAEIKLSNSSFVSLSSLVQPPPSFHLLSSCDPHQLPFSAHSLTLVRHTTHPLLKSLSACQVNVCPAGVDTYTHTHTCMLKYKCATHTIFLLASGV